MLFDAPPVVDSETVLAILFSIFATVVGGFSVVDNSSASLQLDTVNNTATAVSEINFS